MRRLLTFLLTLVLILVAADFGLRFLSEYWVSRQLQRSLDLPSRPSVSLEGFPFIPRVVSGDFSSATVRTGPFTEGGVRLQRMRLTLHDVHFSTRQLLYGKRADIRAARGDGEAVVNAIDASAAPIGPVRVRFAGGGAVITSDRLQGPVMANVALSGSSLVIRSADPALPGSFDIKLPELVAGLRYTQVTVVGSEADLAFVLASPRFEIRAIREIMRLVDAPGLGSMLWHVARQGGDP